MAEIDKNPRQITRLRVEDQAKLEKLASVTEFNEGDYTTQFDGSLNVNGTIKSQEVVIYNDSQLTFYQGDSETAAQSANITITPLFGDIETATQLSFTYNLPDGAEAYSAYLELEKTSNILTDKSVFRHQLTLQSATNTYVGVIYLLGNTPITSTQLLTAYTHAFNGYMFLAVKVTGPADSQNAIGIGYTNNKWATTYSDEITRVSDVVKPL